jgi:hypothetical protein
VSVALDTHAAQHQHQPQQHSHLLRADADQRMVMTGAHPGAGTTAAMMDASGRSVVSASSCPVMDGSLGRSTSSTFSSSSFSPSTAYPTIFMHQPGIVGCNVIHPTCPHVPCNGPCSCHAHSPFFYTGPQAHDIAHHHRSNVAALALSRAYGNYPKYFPQATSRALPPFMPMELAAAGASSASHPPASVTRPQGEAAAPPPTLAATVTATTPPPIPASASPKEGA